MKKPTGPKPNLKQTLEIVQKELDAGNLTRAETIAGHLYIHYPKRPEVNNVLGLIFFRLGKYETAYDCHRTALAGDPRNIQYLLNVGADLGEMGRIVEAESVYRQVRELNSSTCAADLALARFYDQAGMGDRAIGHYDNAFRLAAEGLKPAIRLERLTCLISLGRTEECKREFEAGFPTGDCHSQFVALYESLGRWKVDSEAYAAIVRELQNTKLPRHVRSRLLSSKARIEENSELYDMAFETQLMAKRAVGAQFDMQATRRRFAEIMDRVTGDFLRRTAPAVGHPSQSHVFVVGMPRSGTTLTEQIIASHSMAGGVGELDTMTYLVAKLLGKHPLGEIESVVMEHGQSGILSLAEEYERVTAFLAPGKNAVVDKMPHNFVRIGEISLFFPKARFVHCVRNPADTFISAFQNDMSPAHAYSYDRDSYAEYYELYLRLMRHWYEALPGRIFTLEYEKLVTSPEPVIRALLEFLDLPFEEACLNPQDRNAQVKTFSRLQVRSAINAKSVGRWRNYEKQLAPLAKRFENREPFPAIS